MDKIDGIRHAVDLYKSEFERDPDDMILVVGPSLYEEVKNHSQFVFTTLHEPAKIFGVDIIVKDKIKNDAFGILDKECLDHVDDHIDDMLGYEAKYNMEEIEYINCGLCQHPLSLKMAVGCDITCPWCGDVNDLDDILGDDE